MDSIIPQMLTNMFHICKGTNRVEKISKKLLIWCGDTENIKFY